MSQSREKTSPGTSSSEVAGRVSERSGEVQPLLPGKKPAPVGLLGLERQFGWRFLAFLFCSQHVTKGFVGDLSRCAAKFIFRNYGISAPRMAMYDGVIGLPWALKPALGVIADSCPIGGHSKMPYILLATCLGMWSLIQLASLQAGLGINTIVVLLFMITLYISTVDLLSEAVYAREMRAFPAMGPAMVSFVWAGIDMAGAFAAPVAGLILTYHSPWAVFAFAVVPASMVTWPTVLNWMQEPHMSDEQIRERRASLWAQREAVLLAAIMLVATLLLTWTGMNLTVKQNAIVTFGALVVVTASFSVMLNPVIAKVNAFQLTQAALQLSLSSANFYFMMDDTTQYPEGPHFSVQFYSVVLPICGNVASLLGIYLFTRHSQSWTYQRMYINGNLIGLAANMLDIVFYLRLNTRHGIPDTAFVLGSSALQDTVREWLWMPGAVIISHMCPSGMEAIMYANLAGCHNLGYIASMNFGAWLLELLHVQPNGSRAERHQFDNLWIASLLSSVLPLLAVMFVPWFIPDKLSTEPIFEDGEDISANEGSLLRQWIGRGQPALPSQSPVPALEPAREPAVEPEPEAPAGVTAETA